MSDKPWKQFERDSARLFGGERHPANSGHRLDFETPYAVGQCKEVKNLSLDALTKLAEEMQTEGEIAEKLGVVCVKCRRGQGKKSEPLVVMTWQMFDEYFSFREDRLKNMTREEIQDELNRHQGHVLDAITNLHCGVSGNEKAPLDLHDKSNDGLSEYRTTTHRHIYRDGEL